MDAITIDLLARLEGFYDQEMTRVLEFAYAIIGVIGILIPVGIAAFQTWVQRRYFEREKLQIEQKLSKELARTNERLLRELDEGMKKKEKEFEALIAAKLKENLTAINQAIHRAHGAVYHVQGNALKDKRQYVAAIQSLRDALDEMFQADDEMNAQTCLSILTDDCLPKLTKDDFKASQDLQSDLDGTIELVEANNVNDRYTRAIKEIKRQMKNAQERVPPAPQRG